MQKGITLIELLITVMILAFLVIFSVFYFQRHMMRARDAQRKVDLDNLSLAFEEYFNDKRCYPDSAVNLSCGSSDLQPYLREVPCDPSDGTGSYFYEGMPDGPLVDYCKGYRLLTNLEVDDDPDIYKVGCHPENGCPGAANYNYGIAKGAGVGDTVWQ